MTWNEPKLVIDIGRGILAIFLSISALSLALTKAEMFHPYAKHFLLMSIFSLLITARVCDWMLDHVTSQSWSVVLGRQDCDDFEEEFKKWDGLLFRAKMYANTYLIFSIIVAGVAIFGATEFIEIFRTKNNELIINASKLLSSVSLGLYIPYQMLTIKSKYSEIIFSVISSIIIFFVLYSYFA
ncbi:MAG: hypothetical protein C0620_04440 [Desulfuromonas sp.]|nr:MAG: hypothetical protein C0620_04440 [Desulfuromonas sp.]